jgi:hypothetical protein
MRNFIPDNLLYSLAMATKNRHYNLSILYFTDTIKIFKYLYLYIILLCCAILCTWNIRIFEGQGVPFKQLIIAGTKQSIKIA